MHWAKVTFRYHKKRERFFDLCDVTTQIVCTASGVALFANVFANWAAASLVTLSSIIALVVRYSDRKQRHIELAKRTQKLISDIEKIPVDDVTQEQISAWVQIRSQINADEPPCIRTLVALCEYEQSIEDGYFDHAPKLTRLQYTFCHFF